MLPVLKKIDSSYPMSHSKKPLVCIVGGGVSGLSCAHFLKKYAAQKLDITIVEKRAVLGGLLAPPRLFGALGRAESDKGKSIQDGPEIQVNGYMSAALEKPQSFSNQRETYSKFPLDRNSKQAEQGKGLRHSNLNITKIPSNKTPFLTHDIFIAKEPLIAQNTPLQIFHTGGQNGQTLNALIQSLNIQNHLLMGNARGVVRRCVVGFAREKSVALSKNFSSSKNFSASENFFASKNSSASKNFFSFLRTSWLNVLRRREVSREDGGLGGQRGGEETMGFEEDVRKGDILPWTEMGGASKGDDTASGRMDMAENLGPCQVQNLPSRKVVLMVLVHLFRDNIEKSFFKIWNFFTSKHTHQCSENPSQNTDDLQTNSRKNKLKYDPQNQQNNPEKIQKVPKNHTNTNNLNLFLNNKFGTHIYQQIFTPLLAASRYLAHPASLSFKAYFPILFDAEQAGLSLFSSILNSRRRHRGDVQCALKAKILKKGLGYYTFNRGGSELIGALEKCIRADGETQVLRSSTAVRISSDHQTATVELENGVKLDCAFVVGAIRAQDLSPLLAKECREVAEGLSKVPHFSVSIFEMFFASHNPFKNLLHPALTAGGVYFSNEIRNKLGLIGGRVDSNFFSFPGNASYRLSVTVDGYKMAEDFESLLAVNPLLREQIQNDEISHLYAQKILIQKIVKNICNCIGLGEPPSKIVVTHYDAKVPKYGPDFENLRNSLDSKISAFLPQLHLVGPSFGEEFMDSSIARAEEIAQEIVSKL